MELTEQATFAVGSDAGNGALSIRLSGAWTLRRGLPSAERIEHELAARRPSAVVFEVHELGAWDSALVTFLRHIEALCTRHHVAMHREALPAGVQRLLALAGAVREQPNARRVSNHIRWVARLGIAVLDLAANSVRTVTFIGDVALATGRFVRGTARFRFRDLAVLVQECGARALPIVTLISVLVGMILAFVGAVQLERFGAQIYVADLVGVAMVREMGCIMTGIIMAGRTGSGFAAQIGTMQVTQEVDALTTLGIPAVDFLVLPRIVALCVMMPVLCVYADVLGIGGGAVVGVGMLDLTLPQYVHETASAITFANFAVGVAKSVVFGAVVGIAGCLRGMQAGRSSAAVGDAATSAVVTGIVLIIAADGVFAVLFNMLGI